MNDYRDLLVWKVAHELTLEVYKLSQAFPRDELFGLTSQLRRATSAVPANIAEGNGRGTRKDYLHFCVIARGSLNESRYFAQLALDLKYLAREQHEELEKRISRTAQLLAGLIRSLKGS
jgi:four helix bundle protein